MNRLNAAYNWFAERELALWVCLVLQIIIYWTLACVISGSSGVVVYQRY